MGPIKKIARRKENMKKLLALLLCLSILLVGAAALAEETQLRAGSTLVVCSLSGLD